jgi:hypothetical protein
VTTSSVEAFRTRSGTESSAPINLHSLNLPNHDEELRQDRMRSHLASLRVVIGRFARKVEPAGTALCAHADAR